MEIPTSIWKRRTRALESAQTERERKDLGVSHHSFDCNSDILKGDVGKKNRV